MASLIGRRIVAMLLTMVAVSLVLFLLLEFNIEDVAIKVLGPYSLEESRQIWLQENGYFDPFYERYLRWLWSAITLDFGDSTRFKVPVIDVLGPRLAQTGILALATFAVMVPLALILGVLAGMKEGSLLDRTITVICTVTTSIPEFASAVIFSAVFVFWLRWLPGTSSMSGGFSFAELVLPTLVLIGYGFGYIARMTRASMAEVIMTHYIRTAVLKGVPYQRVILKHALRNALIAPFTVIMLQINWLLSGVIVVEAFFSYKGFGQLLLEASLNQDIYLIEACAMVAVFVAVMTQLIADIGYTYLNPRIRFA